MGLHSPGGHQGHFPGMAARQVQVAAVQAQDQGNEQAQFAVANYQDPGVWPEMNLFGNFQGRGQGLGEDGKGVGDVAGHRMQIGHRQGDILGQAAGLVPDSQHPATGTMVAQAASAAIALAAAQVYFTHHPLTHPIRGRGGNDLAHKLMSQDATEIAVPPGKVNIGLTDAGQADADQGFPGLGLGRG